MHSCCSSDGTLRENEGARAVAGPWPRSPFCTRDSYAWNRWGGWCRAVAPGFNAGDAFRRYGPVPIGEDLCMNRG